jgi:hypothetical protein|tara:strand:+ start:105 stop:950 length:846 start_codon:yes stop_codon:yes gene_type:complete
MAEKEFIKVDVKQEDGTVKKVSIYVQKPSNKIITASDKHKAKVWNQCLSDGILTKMELAHTMRERNIWDEDKDKRQIEIIANIGKTEKSLYVDDGKKKTLSSGKDMAIEIRKLRNELRDLMGEKISLEENTAESISENAKFDYMVSECTKYENGERVYESLDDYNSKSADEVAIAAAGKLAQILYSLDSNFENNLPENKWLTHYGLTDKDGHLINEDNQTIDTSGRVVNDEGHYINGDGKRTDIDGNLLEEDGTYVLTAQYEDDRKPVKKTTRKKTVKADS